MGVQTQLRLAQAKYFVLHTLYKLTRFWNTSRPRKLFLNLRITQVRSLSEDEEGTV